MDSLTSNGKRPKAKTTNNNPPYNEQISPSEIRRDIITPHLPSLRTPPAVSHSTSMTTATSFIPQSAAAITNHPAATTAPHANTSTTIRNIVRSTAMTAITVILSALLSFRASAASRGISSTIVMPDPIGHPQASSLRTSSHHHQPPTTLSPT